MEFQFENNWVSGFPKERNMILSASCLSRIWCSRHCQSGHADAKMMWTCSQARKSLSFDFFRLPHQSSQSGSFWWHISLELFKKEPKVTWIVWTRKRWIPQKYIKVYFITDRIKLYLPLVMTIVDAERRSLMRVILPRVSLEARQRAAEWAIFGGSGQLCLPIDGLSGKACWQVGLWNYWASILLKVSVQIVRWVPVRRRAAVHLLWYLCEYMLHLPIAFTSRPMRLSCVTWTTANTSVLCTENNNKGEMHWYK